MRLSVRLLLSFFVFILLFITHDIVAMEGQADSPLVEGTDGSPPILSSSVKEETVTLETEKVVASPSVERREGSPSLTTTPSSSSKNKTTPLMAEGVSASPLVERRDGSAHLTPGPSPSLKVETTKPPFSFNPDTTKLGVSTTHLKDISPYSVSEIYRATGGKLSLEGLPVRWIFTLDGGGIRGVYEATLLTLVHAIMNHPRNKDAAARKELNKTYPEPILITDRAHVLAGTSTGAVIAAGLFLKDPIELLSLYARYGFKIFQQQSRGITGGITNARYSNEGLDKLLAIYFGNITLDRLVPKDKTLYIFGYNPKDQLPLIYKNTSSESHLRTCKATEALGVSTAAPVYLPARKITHDGTIVPGRDGGMMANCPGWFTYQEEVQQKEADFRLISFGTGFERKGEDFSFDSGITALNDDVIKGVFSGQVCAVLESCRREVSSKRGLLTYFARLQPIVGTGKAKMDDTTPQHIDYMIDRAFGVGRGPVFAQMIKDLGFEMLDMNELQAVENDIYNNVYYSLSKKSYADLTEIEKEWLKDRAVTQMAVDFNFRGYDQMRVNGQLFTTVEKTVFLRELMNDMSKDIGTTETLLNLFWTTDKVKSLEVILRGIDFHRLLSVTSVFTEANVTNLEPANLTALYTEFTKLCSSEDAKYKYLKTVPFIDLVAYIFWKYKLYDLEKRLASDTFQELLSNLHPKLLAQGEKTIGDRAYISKSAEISLRNSRSYVFAKALEVYIKKHFGSQGQPTTSS